MRSTFIFNVEEKLSAAHYLFEGGFYNDAASRAYYSMYYAASGLLLTKKQFARTHHGLLTLFGLEFVKKDAIDKWYAEALSYEKDMREIGDYEITKDITRAEASELIEKAAKFIEKIEDVIKGTKQDG